MGVVRGYKVNFELEQWNHASTCWCKEKSSTVKCGEGTILGDLYRPAALLAAGVRRPAIERL